MILDPALIQACAPTVAVSTVQAIIDNESAGNPIAVNVNGGGPLREPGTLQEAIARVRYALAQGLTADIGLMQVNTSNLAAYGLSIEAAFEPCKNLHAGADILTRNYQAAVAHYGAGQASLMAALSAYNTGNYADGFTNGYVAKYYRVSLSPAASSPRAGTSAKRKAMAAIYAADPVIYQRTGQ